MGILKQPPAQHGLACLASCACVNRSLHALLFVTATFVGKFCVESIFFFSVKSRERGAAFLF